MNINFAFDTYMLPKGRVQALVGQVVGSVKHSFGATDLSSYVLQAQASKAQVVMVLNFTSDIVNTLKAAGAPQGWRAHTHAGQRVQRVTHYLKAVQATVSDEGPGVVARMKATPVDDFQTSGGRSALRAGGFRPACGVASRTSRRVLHD